MNQQSPHSDVLASPLKPAHLPGEIRWLSGEGCGSWFHLEEIKDSFLISRYSPEGKLECRGVFQQVSGKHLDMKFDYDFTYLSHCAEVSIIQNSENLIFKLKSKCQ